jgi:prepilin-type N-terminal cleavage/methylation domain-containing protein
MARDKGFTLSEVLIALLLLGVLAAFAIPKLLQSVQDQQYNTLAKETQAMIVEAFTLYKAQNGDSGQINVDSFLALTNNLGADTTTDLNSLPTLPDNVTCAGGNTTCLRLKSGGVLFYTRGQYFPAGVRPANQVVTIGVDPNGRRDNVKAIMFRLYASGKIYTDGVAPSPDQTCDAVYGCQVYDISTYASPQSLLDPSYWH